MFASLFSQLCLQFLHSVCRPGNREKLRYSQAELGPAIKSAVAYFASISGVANGMQELYVPLKGTTFFMLSHIVSVLLPMIAQYQLIGTRLMAGQCLMS